MELKDRAPFMGIWGISSGYKGYIVSVEGGCMVVEVEGSGFRVLGGRVWDLRR